MCAQHLKGSQLILLWQHKTELYRVKYTVACVPWVYTKTAHCQSGPLILTLLKQPMQMSIVQYGPTRAVLDICMGCFRQVKINAAQVKDKMARQYIQNGPDQNGP